MPILFLIIIAWLYVALITALNQTSFIGGVMSFLGWGLIPIIIIVYIATSPARKRIRQAQMEENRKRLSEDANSKINNEDSKN